MLIHRIEERLEEEEVAGKYTTMLDKLLERVEDELKDMFVKTNIKGKWSSTELNKYNRKLKLRDQIRANIKQYKNDFKKEFRNELEAKYKQEALYIQDNLSTVIDKDFSRLPTRAIKTQVIDDVTIAGKKLGEYLDKFSVDFAFRVEQEIFEGIALGENPREVSRRLARTGKVGAKRAEDTTRSWYNKIINESTFDVYQQAGIQQSRYIATLDGRTSAICITRHNQIYTVEEIRKLLPAHCRCRSTGIPIIDGVSQSKPNDYKDWILDGRRSMQQLNKTSSKIQQAYKAGQIKKKDKDRFEKVLNRAFRNAS
ncbi:minor capsid protein [Halonatronum saccharophilum]|uniref:minor capsid protein n=1 Tax=Halonatronum saccharophilum TaxID=150060 RepID=UPI0004861827|nr:minor capsid protein [Halonatronum saccharophilum]